MRSLGTLERGIKARIAVVGVVSHGQQQTASWGHEPGLGIDKNQNCSVHATHTTHCGTSLRASRRKGLCGGARVSGAAMHINTPAWHEHANVIGMRGRCTNLSSPSITTRCRAFSMVAVVLTKP